MQHVGRAADIGAIHVAHIRQADIFDHGKRAEARRVARAIVGVDVSKRQAGICQRADSAFHMDLRGGHVRRFARGMLKYPRDIRRAF